MRLTLLNGDELARGLFDFLVSISGRDTALPGSFLLASPETVEKVLSDPGKPVLKALGRCIDTFRQKLAPFRAERFGPIETTASLLGAAIVLQNALALVSLPEKEDADLQPVETFNQCLCEILAPVTEPPGMMAWQAVMEAVNCLETFSAKNTARFLGPLLERSPLAALLNVHLYTPAALLKLQETLLPDLKTVSMPNPPLKTETWETAADRLFSHEAISRLIRHRWLFLPQNRTLCKNIGLVLESMRRRNEDHPALLRFYMEYAHFRWVRGIDPWRGPVRVWPVIETAAGLLKIEGNSKAARIAATRGNAYGLLFYPLVQRLRSKTLPFPGLPRSAKDMESSVEFLYKYMGLGSEYTMDFTPVSFVGERP